LIICTTARRAGSDGRPIVPDNDPNEAYELHPADWRNGWWKALCNGIAVQHFSPNAKDKGEREKTD